jgi:hypothetical protein
VWLYERYFRGVRDGLVIEVGAGDGFTQSYSFFFQHYANFTAMHIEGDESTYARLQLVRPHSVNVQAAICNERKRVHWGQALKRRMRGVLELMPHNFLATHYPSLSSSPALVQSENAIKCVPLRDVFKRVDLQHASLMVVDVNGAETATLEGLDHSSFSADVISAACTHSHAAFRGASGRDSRHIFKALEHAGYTCDIPRPGRCVCVSAEYAASDIFANVNKANAKDPPH